MMRYAQGLVLGLALAAISPAASAGPGDDASQDASRIDRIDRLIGLARIWAEVKFFHPAMFQRAIDWDGALIRALPEVEAATDAASYRAAIAHLLAAVGDPRTSAEGEARSAPPNPDWKSWPTKDVLVLDARLPTDRWDVGATRRIARELRTEITAARVVVVDLRDRDDEDRRLLASILDSLPATRSWPTVRSIQHTGFRSQGETNRNTFPTSWNIASAGAPTPGAVPGPIHVVFAVDPRHALPIEAVALWASGHATLVSPVALDDSAAAMLRRVPLPYGVVAQVRTADVILPDGRGLSADVVLGRGDDVRARAIAIASAIAAGGAPPHGQDRRATTSGDLVLSDDDDRPTTGLPPRERRVLAAFRAWAVIEYFHGPRRLDHDWEQQLRAVLPRLDAVTDVDGYRDALAEMLVPLRDGHTAVYRAGESAGSWTAIYWRRIEGKIVAGGLRDEAVARQAGIALGDELLGVDGVPAEDIVARKLPTISGGVEEGRMQWAVGSVDRGPRDTAVDVEIRRRDGKPRHVPLVRSYHYASDNFWAHPGPHHRVLAGNIGYADLTRVTGDELDAMFEALGGTRAIVFDMRGYPHGIGGLVAARVNSRAARVVAEFRTPVVTAHGTDVYQTYLQSAVPFDRPIYRGRIVVLVDDRAVSAGEHACLELEATGGATFVGSPSDGTNGEETYVRLPGGFELRFTGQEVFHADGRQLQQIGIQPAITIRPTLRGLRAGKDEVLERALRHVQTGR